MNLIDSPLKDILRELKELNTVKNIEDRWGIMLNAMDIKYIEKFLRKKKLENLKNKEE